MSHLRPASETKPLIYSSIFVCCLIALCSLLVSRAIGGEEFFNDTLFGTYSSGMLISVMIVTTLLKGVVPHRGKSDSGQTV